MRMWNYALGFAPVLLFLAGLRLMDSFKLVHARTLALALCLGAAAAGAAYLLHRVALARFGVDPDALRHVVGPCVEESLKAACLVWFLRGDRVGFLVDAAIVGFAIGTGFALVENIYYVGALADPSAALWLTRGLGTAVMHGSTAAIMAIVVKTLEDRHPRRALLGLVPALLLAIGIHAAFNDLPFQPLLTSAVLLVVMPLLMLGVFERSERLTRAWLVSGFDTEIDMLEQIVDHEVHGTAVGRYLAALRRRFDPIVVADLLCLLRVHLELSLRAKGILIARAAGVELPPDPAVRANLDELAYLERTVGATGRLAILPLRRTGSRDLWQIMLLERSSPGRARTDSLRPE
jgi:RsiW-degrading membrane proteinase PrsW (M82 family)